MNRWNDATERRDGQALDELRTFRKDCGSYVRLYDFMSQVVDYGTSDLEKLAEFLRQLTRLLPGGETGADVDVSGLELRRVRQVDQGRADIALSGDQDTPALPGITGVGSRASRPDPQQVLLAEVVARINALFGAEFADPQIEGFGHSLPQAWPRRTRASSSRSITMPSISSSPRPEPPRDSD